VLKDYASDPTRFDLLQGTCAAAPATVPQDLSSLRTSASTIAARMSIVPLAPNAAPDAFFFAATWNVHCVALICVKR
jgi:hypothetical protein